MTRRPALLLTRPGDASAETLAEYVATGGYSALAAARAGSPDAVVAAVEQSGLRGRGGAGFLVARKWQLARAARCATKHVVVNGGEHEPGSYKDRVLLAQYAHRVLEGAALCAFATGASSIVLYLASDLGDAIAAAREAVSDARDAGMLAGLDVRVVLAPPSYMAGEETAALEVIEGRPPRPRRKPPYPGEAGLHGQPTTVQNVETLAWVARIVREGPAWFLPGAVLCTLDATFARPGLVEVPVGTSLRSLVDEYGGGTRAGRRVKAIQPAPSSAFLPASALDLPLSHDALRDAGSNLGCGTFSVVEEGACIVEHAVRIAEFFKKEQCGQCPPCRMETATIAAVLQRVAGGEPGDYAGQVEKIAAFARGKGNCSLVDMAAAPALSALRLFGGDFQAHAATGRCP